MKLKFWCIVLLTIVLSNVYAQSNYSPGYVVSNSGDTVKAFIDYREWAKSPVRISLKKDLKSNQKTEVTASQIKAFQVNGLVNYRSYSGKISIDRAASANLPFKADTSSAYRTCFLQLLVSGPNADLYSYTDSLKTRFFVTEQDGQPFELSYHQYYRNESQAARQDIYKSQLLDIATKYAPDDQSLSLLIGDADYTRSDLIAVIKRINRNTTDKANTGQRASAGRFFLGAGLSYSSTSITGKNFFENAKSHTDYSPRFSAGYDIFLTPNTQRLFLRGEFSVFFIHPEFSMSDKALGITNGTFGFKQTNISFIPQAIYNIYNTNSIKAFIGIGMVISHLSNSDNVTTEYFGSNPAMTLPPYNLKSSEATFTAEAGIAIEKHIEVNVTYLSPSNASNDTDFSISTKTVCVGLKYLF